MSLREGQTLESRLAIVEVILEERHRLYMQLFQSQESAFAESVRGSREAIQKAEVATEKRFESVNEFRGQLGDVIKNLMPRTESTSRWQGLADRVDALQSRIDRREGSGSGMRQGWGLLVGGIAAVGALIAMFVALSKSPQTEANQARIDAQQRAIEQLQQQQRQPAAK